MYRFLFPVNLSIIVFITLSLIVTGVKTLCNCVNTLYCQNILGDKKCCFGLEG